jgi:hypothetical protein
LAIVESPGGICKTVCADICAKDTANKISRQKIFLTFMLTVAISAEIRVASMAFLPTTFSSVTAVENCGSVAA